jgi:hypothetical protein
MPLETAYATIVDLKARLDITSADSDGMLGQLLDAASRQVDGWCGRVFSSGTGTRRVTADSADLLILPDDLHSMSAIAMDWDADQAHEYPWALTDVDLQPYPGPYQIVRPRRGLAFPTHRYGIEITGVWGFGLTVPDAIREATLLQAARLYKRKDAPFGIAGTADHGQLQTISRVDPDVNELIAPYIRHGLVV